MTKEKLEKAKELTNNIKFLQEQLAKINLVEGDNQTEIISNNRSFCLPLDIKEMVILMCKSDYENKIKQKEKEFEEL